jgi:GT2 family glycosyltransferase
MEESAMKVSIVILNWNDGAANCLAAVASANEQDYPDKEIIFVDNGSTDGSLQAVEQIHPSLHFVRKDTNLGCPGGRNVGASAAKGDLICFLETDGVWGSNDVVSGAVKVFVEYPEIGALYTRVEGYDSHMTDPPIDKTVATDIDKGLYLSSSFRGGASIVRRSLFNTIGQFPSDFIRQYEERYISLLIYQKGYLVVYWPEKVLRHRGSDYTGKSAAVFKFNCINELKTIQRVYPEYVWPIYFVCKAVLWFQRMLCMGKLSLLKEVLCNVWGGRKAVCSQGRISLHVLCRINGIRYGRRDCRLLENVKRPSWSC